MSQVRKTMKASGKIEKKDETRNKEGHEGFFKKRKC